MADVTENRGGGSATTDGAISVRTAGAPVEERDPTLPHQPADARTAGRTSFDVDDFAVPGGREEEWRFTPLARLRGLHDGTAVADGKITVSTEVPAGVTVEEVDRTDARLGRAGAPADRIAAQAYSSFEQARVVTIPKDAVLTEPVRISVHGDGGTAYAHLQIEAEAFSEAMVVIEHTGEAVLAANVECVLGDGAKLTVVSVQDWDDAAVHVAQHTTSVGRDAGFKSVIVSLGGDVVRLHPRVHYAGPGGEAELFGLYFSDAKQHLEHRLLVDHDQPHCRSNVMYKGALQGAEASAVWIGDVLIRAIAEGTDTYELNRNLVLTDGAQVHSVPNLEIETGEIVGAGHASATGRFDDEQLFYLQARGIPADEARRLVVRGFFAELLQQIGLPELQDALMKKIETELEATVS